MNNRILGVIGIAILAIVILLWNSLFIVRQDAQALVLQFGNVVRTIRDPGLFFKVPFVQQVEYFDEAGNTGSHRIALGLEQRPQLLQLCQREPRHPAGAVMGAVDRLVVDHHQFVIAGAPPNMDGDRLIADCQRICAAQQAFWQMPEAPEPIFKHYLFMLHATEDGYGGLEHGNSTALICAYLTPSIWPLSLRKVSNGSISATSSAMKPRSCSLRSLQSNVTGRRR